MTPRHARTSRHGPRMGRRGDRWNSLISHPPDGFQQHSGLPEVIGKGAPDDMSRKPAMPMPLDYEMVKCHRVLWSRRERFEEQTSDDRAFRRAAELAAHEEKRNRADELHVLRSAGVIRSCLVGGHGPYLRG